MTCCFAGDQSVQSQVQPEYQHDQEVHRGAHRQAVHRAEPDLGGRVQLRGLGLSRGGRGEALTPARPAGADGREAVAALSGSCGLKKISKRKPNKNAKDEKRKRTPLSSLRLLDGRRPALIICGDCKQDWCLHRSKYSNNKRKKRKGHCVTSDTTTTTTFPITTTTTTLPTHLLIIFKAVYNITSAVRACVATTKRRKERNASGCWTERRERENEKQRSQNRAHWWLHIKESCFLFLTFWSCRVFYFYFFVKCTDLGKRKRKKKETLL